MSEWRKVILSDIASFTTGKLNSNAAVENGKYPFFTCSPETLRIDNYAFEQEAILLAGNNAEGNFNIKYYNGKFNAYQRTYVFTAKDNCVLRFLFYSLKLCLDNFKRISQGTATKFLTAKILNSFELMLPNLKMQQQIASILSAIDDKIELNTAINENLEQQAQALFKAWFVDFEPFGGVMPDDWAVTTLGTIAAISTKSINPLKQPDLYLEHYSIPAYDEQHYPVFEYASEVKSNKYILTNNSVMISKLNPDTKRIWRPLCLSANPVCSTEFIVYEAVNPKYKDYIYSLIDSQAFSDYLCAHTTGSTNSRQRATPNATLDYTCIMPSDDIITRFCGIVTPMYDQIASNIIESQRLAALRDTLLPKLMNGEIDVSAVKI